MWLAETNSLIAIKPTVCHLQRFDLMAPTAVDWIAANLLQAQHLTTKEGQANFKFDYIFYVRISGSRHENPQMSYFVSKDT